MKCSGCGAEDARWVIGGYVDGGNVDERCDRCAEGNSHTFAGP